MNPPPGNLGVRIQIHRFLSGYGMVLALGLLCLYFSWITWAEQHPAGSAAADILLADLSKQTKAAGKAVIVARNTPEDLAFTRRLKEGLDRQGWTVLDTVNGGPVDARRALDRISTNHLQFDVIAANAAAAGWTVFQNLSEFSGARQARLVQPRSYWWPNFLKADNLLNVANQIVVIALVAIGMTMVIIAGGIDLSVGSMIALSAVLATRLIRDWAGAEQAGALGIVASCLAGIALCGLIGAASGYFVTQFGIPPFIVTLGTMLVASGVAFILAKGQSIYQVPDSFIWLGRGIGFLGIPNAVWLMAAGYAVGHVIMDRTTLGRYIYAIGGNRQAALLSGVPVRRITILTYVFSSALAGLGGVVTASQLKSGAPTYGGMYELYVIAAVVVGGTSLLGGEGKMLGTLIGAFIIAVIQNGMNLTGVESYTQKVVLGLLILGAVLLDQFRKFALDRLIRRGVRTR